MVANMFAIEAWIKRQKVVRGLIVSLIREEEETDLKKIESRTAACYGECPFNQKDLCIACGGCVIDLKIGSRTNLNIKTGKIEITHCPKAKWPGEEEVSKLYSYN